jgi:hypothetical protein
MSSMMFLGRNRLRIGTSQPPIAQPAPNRSGAIPSAGRLANARWNHTTKATEITTVAPTWSSDSTCRTSDALTSAAVTLAESRTSRFSRLTSSQSDATAARTISV